MVVVYEVAVGGIVGCCVMTQLSEKWHHLLREDEQTHANGPCSPFTIYAAHNSIFLFGFAPTFLLFFVTMNN
jgi:hypothetical protein